MKKMFHNLRFIWLVLMGSTLVGYAADPPRAGGTPTADRSLLFLGDFEHGIISLTRDNPKSPWNQSGNAPVVVTAPEPVRSGHCSMKSVLERKTSPVSYRTEVVPRGNHFARIGQEYWYGFSIYFTQEWIPDDIWEVVAQWHDFPDTELGETWRNPILSFSVVKDELVINNLWDSRQLTPVDSKGRHQYEGSAKLWRGPMANERGRWTDWVVHMKWSHLGDGITEIWRNGEKITDRKGPNCFNDKIGPYFKMGIYKGWMDRETPQGTVGRRVIYHDEVRIAGPGGSFEA
jgi:hypothetical protein